MRLITAKCDKCGFEKTYDADNYILDELKGWASMVIYGQCKNIEICPECVKSFIGVTKLEEEKENDQNNN